MSKIIAFANQKGGVGKTTNTINLATAMAAINKKVLIIDSDPQGNASTGLGIDEKDREPTLYKLLSEGKLNHNSIKKTAIPDLDIITANIELAASEVELVDVEERESRLKKILDEINGYDYFFIDCPPALGLLTINGLVAADSVIVPLQCEFFALEGLGALNQTINLIKNSFNEKLKIEGLVLTMHDKRNSQSDLVEKDVRNYYKNKVYKTIIPRNVRISEAPSHGKPALIYDIKCSGAIAYIQLAKEVILNQK